MSLFGQTKRHTPSSQPRRSPLPTFTIDREKKFNPSSLYSPVPSSSGWITFVYVALPRFSRSSSSKTLNGNGYSAKPYRSRPQYVRLPLPIPPRLYARIPKLNSLRFLLSGLLVGGLFLFLLGFRKSRDGGATWSPPFVDPNTLILSPEELAMVWEWEILSGHYPSIRSRGSV